MAVDQAPDIERARDAIRRASWGEAYGLLRDADPAHLTADDLNGLADAAWWTSRVQESLAARRKAYSAYLADGARRRAAHVAWLLAIEFAWRGDQAVAAGWVRRARRDLEGEPECVEHGYLVLAEADLVHQRGELDEARALAAKAADAGRRHGDPNLMALGIQTQGRALISLGQVAEGAGLLDEAMISVIAGELTPFVTGWIYCQVVWACLEVADLKRAGEWTEAAMTWCESLAPEAPWPGMCRLNRVEVSALLGRLAEAEGEALRASEELMAYEPMLAGAALAALGEIRRRRGDLAGAEEALTRAHELGWLGWPTQPGLALVRLDQGRADEAATVLGLALSDPSWNRLGRVRLLAAHVEAAVAAGDLQAARVSTEELEAIAGDFASPALEATAALSRGRLLLSSGDAAEAIGPLRKACATWQELRAPHEVARARMLLGVASREAGDADGGRLDLQTARSEFERLGATRDVRAVTALLEGPSPLPGGLTARQAEVLRLVAAGQSNRQIAAQLFISEHTVARHLQNIFARLGVSSRAAAAAFAVDHGLV